MHYARASFCVFMQGLSRSQRQGFGKRSLYDPLSASEPDGEEETNMKSARKRWMGWLAAGLLAACGAIPAMADGTRAHPTPRGYDGESLFPWSTLPPEISGYYSNSMEIYGIRWFFGAQMNMGSAPTSPEYHPIALSYTEHAVPYPIIHLYWDMTLTRFEYLNTNSSRDITIPDVSWNLHGAEEGRGYSGLLQYIPSSVFNGSDITSVTIPYTLLALQEPCFLNCRDLKSIKIVWGGGDRSNGRRPVGLYRHPLPLAGRRSL